MTSSQSMASLNIKKMNPTQQMASIKDSVPKSMNRQKSSGTLGTASLQAV